MRRKPTVSRVPRCRSCGCTEDNCSECVARTGQPCYWFQEDLCSACRGLVIVRATPGAANNTARAGVGAAAAVGASTSDTETAAKRAATKYFGLQPAPGQMPNRKVYVKRDLGNNVFEISVRGRVTA